MFSHFRVRKAWYHPLAALLAFCVVMLDDELCLAESSIPVINWSGDREFMLLYGNPKIQCGFIDSAATSIEAFESLAASGQLTPLINPVIGFREDTLWCQLAIRNASTVGEELYLEVAYAFHDTIRFYVQEAGRYVLKSELGDTRPFGDRPVSGTGFILPLTWQSGETKVIAVEMQITELMGAPFVLSRPERNRMIKEHWNLLRGAIYGGSVLLAIFHLILFAFTRSAGYLTFAFYVLSQTAFLIAFRGIGFEYLWPDALEWHRISIPFLSALLQISWIIVGISFLPVAHLPRIWKRSAIGLTLAFLAVAVAAFFDRTSMPYEVATFCTMLTVVWLVTGTMMGWKYSRSAKVFALAFGLNIVFTLSESLRIYRLVDYILEADFQNPILTDAVYFLWAHLSEIGVLASEIFLAVGLADQINLLRSDRARLRKEALDAALVSQEMLKSEVERQTLELKESRDRLLKIDEEKTAFFRMVSHELRTPLTLLQLPLERLDDEMGENPSLDMARRNAMRLQRLVNQLLDLQKSEVGRREEPLIRIEVHPFLATAGLYFAEAALAKGVHFELRRDGAAIDPSEDDGEPLYMHADIDGLEKIVFNYLANALKFTDVGGTIALGYRSLESGNIRIEVSDTGVGISDQDIKRLFSAFTQLDDSAARKVEGTGLGLALCKQLADYMGGEVGVSSAVGEGSNFYLEVPAIEVTTEVASLEWAPREWLMAEHQQRVGELRSEDDSRVSAVDGRGKRVLVVDDLPDMRSLLGTLLKANGYTIVEAGDGQEALALASRQPLDLMITDWMMPEMSGPELIASIRELPEKQGLPIILLTANADERARIEGVDTGADAF